MELKTRDLLIADGYDVTKSGGSLGLFDLLAVGPIDLRMIQVKANRKPGKPERERLEAYGRNKLPNYATAEIWVWRDYAREPDILVWNGEGYE